MTADGDKELHKLAEAGRKVLTKQFGAIYWRSKLSMALGSSNGYSYRGSKE